MRDIAAIFITILLLSARPFAYCPPPPPPACEALAAADVVFYGEVLESTTHPDRVRPGGGGSNAGHQDLRFTVLRAYKGVVNGLFGGGFRMDSESIRFAPKLRYLVFTSLRDGLWRTSCSRTTEIITRLRLDEVRYIQEVE